MNAAPGARLRAVAQRFCSRRTMDHLVDPILADMQAEWRHLSESGRPWRARLHYLWSWVGLLRALSLHVLLVTAWGSGTRVIRGERSAPGTARVASVVLVTLVSAMVAVEAVAAIGRGTSEFGALLFFLLLAVVGGAGIALLLVIGSRARRRFTSDPFEGTAFSSDAVNFAHVRVAGVGGAGLVVLSIGVALQFQLTTIVLALGLAGGLAWALVLIRLRQRRA
jgi:hypothetical protein